MNSQISESQSRKITVTVPESLLIRLDNTISARKRSLFIVQAVEEKLALQEQFAAIEESAGAWSDENHPEMATDENIDKWLADLRSSWPQESSS